MEIDVLKNLLNELGYFGVFLWLWLGMLGIPVPNEVVVASIGYLSTTPLLKIEKVIIIGYLGLISSLTTSYLLGRIVGKRFVRYFSIKPGSKSSLRKASKFNKKISCVFFNH
ncbi:hypothetical protein BKP45_11235 [Anaerobacillus alkalidiazotrophicus]|uniref:DedA family protein n=1 Tax=Anaerobacillus alkalidiazotrophicus TaxID=472963 RepID=A0A1S2M0W4_9BACI|nr:hypothetical protein [Anaerobacillus alkalidiazotrophicus]OIJ18160.1 hypothetical protein BKP45_16950 [Anaerobacillus alkalidiazotrophicus]OIJ19639.1 hypothetical protein BKP45_11235 [Anaerobacillus alkalidiazotrophicus]